MTSSSYTSYRALSSLFGSGALFSNAPLLQGLFLFSFVSFVSGNSPDLTGSNTLNSRASGTVGLPGGSKTFTGTIVFGGSTVGGLVNCCQATVPLLCLIPLGDTLHQKLHSADAFLPSQSALPAQQFSRSSDSYSPALSGASFHITKGTPSGLTRYPPCSIHIKDLLFIYPNYDVDDVDRYFDISLKRAHWACEPLNLASDSSEEYANDSHDEPLISLVSNSHEDEELYEDPDEAKLMATINRLYKWEPMFLIVNWKKLKAALITGIWNKGYLKP
ncbi:uncharacterized protein F5147DRAFT_771621 [Suillus discolor]|uniref:Uncharacterized protein n=1 Tax=Suillus discolor TaxID=1912936 RepID=A0A9P7FA87_9AGAM|nr:uncharacterized protein F5147DRAFT_771621 [Suillus discolor]KAG2112059.1 hypothetical protein F5147DRAFT_771621 [Suillus discolor]